MDRLEFLVPELLRTQIGQESVAALWSELRMGKSRILVVGASGKIGKYIVPASVKEGHPTFFLTRPGSSASNPAKQALVTEFESLGAISLPGDLDDHASLVAALKQVDVVISAVGNESVLDGQRKLIAAIKEVGHIKRFFPSEFGANSDNKSPIDMSKILEVVFASKREIRNELRETGVPHTFVATGGFAGVVWASLGQVGVLLSGILDDNVQPPRDKITVLGDGEGLVVTNAEVDIATLTVKAADDPRTLNKQLVIRHKPNLVTFNSIVELWEKKIGHKLQKTFVPAAEVQKQIDGLSPDSLANLLYAVFWQLVSGREVFPLSAGDVDADELYPDYKHVAVDEYLDSFVEKK